MFLLEKYTKYCTSLKEAHTKKLASIKSSSVINIHAHSTIHKVLFLPFLNLYDVISLFNHLLKNSQEWRKISVAIRDQGFEVILPEKSQHAEMKMLEVNNFKIEIFTTGAWKAMITKPPCVICWMLFCACTEKEEERVKITEKFGGSGFIYLLWEIPSAKNMDQERKKWIRSNYLGLIRKHATEIETKESCLEIGKKRKLDEKVEELTSVREVVNDKLEELILFDNFEERAFWNYE